MGRAYLLDWNRPWNQVLALLSNMIIVIGARLVIREELMNVIGLSSMFMTFVLDAFAQCATQDI